MRIQFKEGETSTEAISPWQKKKRTNELLKEMIRCGRQHWSAYLFGGMHMLDGTARRSSGWTARDSQFAEETEWRSRNFKTSQSPSSVSRSRISPRIREHYSTCIGERIHTKATNIVYTSIHRSWCPHEIVSRSMHLGMRRCNWRRVSAMEIGGKSKREWESTGMKGSKVY